jgi:hypothetical protein
MDYYYYPCDEAHLLNMEMEILKSGKIEGVISPTFKALPSQVGLFYDLKGCIPLAEYLEAHSFSLDRWNIFVDGTASVIAQMKDFFLVKERLQLQYDAVYVDDRGELCFLYLPVKDLRLEKTEAQLFREVIFGWRGIEERYLAMMTQIVQHKTIDHFHIYGFEETYEKKKQEVESRDRVKFQSIGYKAPLMALGAIAILLMLFYGLIVIFRVDKLVLAGSLLILTAVGFFINQHFGFITGKKVKEQATVLATKEAMTLEHLGTGEVVDVVASPFIFGRDRSCHLHLDKGAVSRLHAQIAEHHGYYELEDLGSRNGTYLNKRRLQRKKHLKEGDEIDIADERYRVHLD